MANHLYNKWKENLLQFTANNNLSAGTVKVALVDAGQYTTGASTASTDQFFSSVTGVAGTPQIIGTTTKTFINGAFIVSPTTTTFTAVPAGSGTPASNTILEALVIYIDTGTAATSPLVAYLDTLVTGLPVTPNGGDIVITWNGSGIFIL